jgi:hypothetical protein
LNRSTHSGSPEGRADRDAYPERIGGNPVAGICKREARRRDGELRGATGLAGIQSGDERQRIKAPDLSAEMDRMAARIEGLHRTDAAASVEEVTPERLAADAD